MKKCVSCDSDLIVSISGKTCDCFVMSYQGKEYQGYVPENIGLGEGGDDIELSYCINCGMIQDTFPKDKEEVEKVFDEDRFTDDEDN